MDRQPSRVLEIRQWALHSGLLDAFTWFGGSPKQLVVDNMATAVVERLGSVVRFNDSFLDFLMHFFIEPVACNPGSPFEKGKVESGVKYIRRTFMPLRTFSDLEDVQRQALSCLTTVNNVRTHQTTGERPVQRFEKVNLTPLPECLPKTKQIESLLVHKDFAVRFDRNTLAIAHQSHIVIFSLKKRDMGCISTCFRYNLGIILAGWLGLCQNPEKGVQGTSPDSRLSYQNKGSFTLHCLLNPHAFT